MVYIHLRRRPRLCLQGFFSLEQDRPDIVELTQEQDPGLPITPCASSDGTLPETGTEPCRCGTASCSTGQFCDAENDVCLANCGSVPTVCSTAGTLPLPNQDQIPCLQGGCAPEQCCLPTCGDGSQPEDAACACGTAECGQGEFCDEANNVCLANCGSVPTVCSTAGTLPLPNQDQIPCLQGSCAAEQCCLPTCGDGSQPEDAACACGTAECGQGEFCDEANNVCLANCGSVPTVCSTAGTLPLPNQDQIPCLQGSCAPEQCCLPTCGDGSQPEDAACACGTAECGQGEFCDEANNVCLANCGSVPTVCSTAGTLPLPNQDQIPCLQGSCAAEQCCLPTCGDGSQPEDAACACGTAECGQGEFCDEANNVCLANCGSVPTVCSTAGTLPLPNQDQIPCLQGSCAAEQCCLPTCGDGSQPEDAACACGVNTCTSGQTCESGSCVAPSAPPSCAESQPAAGDCTCGGTMCIAGQFCESGSSTCLSSCATASTSICNGTGLLPNANTIPCNASGCTAGTCCSSPAPDVTCSTYDCTGLRWHADPAKASVTCKPSGCDHYTCCKFLRLRRRRRKGQYYNDNGDGYYAGSPELIVTEESEERYASRWEVQA